MIYLITQQWVHLKNNHAGYPHICKLLSVAYPDKYQVIECDPVSKKNHRAIRPFRKIVALIDTYLYYLDFKRKLKEKCRMMFDTIKEGDSVFLLEYNLRSTPQYDLARIIKKRFKNVRVVAMTHLTPTQLKKTKKNKKRILKWDAPVDMHLTLGSSLTYYLISIGIAENKVSTGFHAVDMNYYHPLDDRGANPQTTIITMGALQRDYIMLSEVVKRCPDVNWIICKGKKDVGDLFVGLSNVNLVGFVEENELRRLMNSADVSMSVFEDTIGSNVITTSMAMGLAMVVSDVGSIRDYCDDNNTIFCKNTIEEFVQAINALKDKTKLENMKQASLERVKQFSITRTHEWFSNLKIIEYDNKK